MSLCRCGYSDREIFDSMVKRYRETHDAELKRCFKERDDALEERNSAVAAMKAMEQMSVIQEFKLMREALERLEKKS
jgi:hypothetical protein